MAICRLTSILVIAVFAGFSVLGQDAITSANTTSRKRAWEWTVAERLEGRTNAAAARARIHAAAVGKAKVQSSSSSGDGRIADSFDGKTHPELFLPHEVFDELIRLSSMGDSRSTQILQMGLMSEVRRHGLPPDFWSRLAASSAVYVADLRAVEELGAGYAGKGESDRRRVDAAMSIKYGELCRSAADALDAARREFGRDRLERFLYEVVAVKMFYVADRIPDPKVLRRAEDGCR